MPKAGIQFQKKDQWNTPKEVVDFFGPFDYDPATTKEQAESLGIPNYDTIETDGLKADWAQYHSIWINPPFCIAYDAEDEILTKVGWKRYLDISKEDEILSVGTDKQLEYVHIEEIIYQDYNGKMVSYRYPRGRDDALMVTYNHRCVTDDGFVRAEDLKEGDYYTDGYEYTESAKTEVKVLEQVDLDYPSKNQYKTWQAHKHIDARKMSMVDWAKFLGLWMADGSITRSKNSVSGRPKYSIYIGQNEERERQILDIMEPLGFKIHKTKSYIRGGYYHYYIHSIQLWNELNKYGKSDSKFIPREILDGDKDILQAFYDGYILGDSHNSYKGIILGSRSLQLIKDLQELCLKLGRICHCAKRNCWYKGANLPYYQLLVREANNKLSYHQIRNVDGYNGKIFCLHLTKNHNFFVRHSGYISNTGNTKKFDFLYKLMNSLSLPNHIRTVCVLLPIETLTTKRFHQIVKEPFNLIVPNGRIKFDDGSGRCSSPAFGSAVLVFGSGQDNKILKWRLYEN